MRYHFLTVEVPYHTPEGIKTINLNFGSRTGEPLDRRFIRKVLRKQLSTMLSGVTSAECAQLIAHGKSRTFEEMQEMMRARVHAMLDRMEDEVDEDESLGHTQAEAASAAGTGV